MLKFFILKLLGIFDFYHQYKIIKFLKKNNFKLFKIFFDVGAHKGESIKLFLKNFNIEKIFSFEASEVNFKDLEKKIISLRKKFFKTKIIIENLTLGSINQDGMLKQSYESSSSTLKSINEDSKYFKRKFKLLNFFKKSNFFKEIQVKIVPLSDYMQLNNIRKIDFLKIDTEGYEYEILLGLKNQINKVHLIMFEHHYDNMIIKNYKYKDIKNFLNSRNFKKIYMAKMPFRKTFEYIYENKKIN